MLWTLPNQGEVRQQTEYGETMKRMRLGDENRPILKMCFMVMLATSYAVDTVLGIRNIRISKTFEFMFFY